MIVPGAANSLLLNPTKKISCTYKGATANSDTSSPTITFTGVDIGTARPNRLVVCCLVSWRVINTSLNSATINGVTATIDRSMGTPSSSTGAYAIFSAVVPSGTSVNVSVTMSQTSAAATLHTYVIENYQSATPYSFPSTVNSPPSNPASISISPEANTAWIAFARGYNSVPGGITSFGGTAGLTADISNQFAGGVIASRVASKVFSAAASGAVEATFDNFFSAYEQLTVIGFR